MLQFLDTHSNINNGPVPALLNVLGQILYSNMDNVFFFI